MPDDKTKMDARDRSKVAEGEDYEVAFLAKRHGLDVEVARRLVCEHGNNRMAIEKAIEDMKL
jgi:hypothetical protein